MMKCFVFWAFIGRATWLLASSKANLFFLVYVFTNYGRQKHHVVHIIKLITIIKTQRCAFFKIKHQFFFSHRKLFCGLLAIGLLTQAVILLNTNYKAKVAVYFKALFITVHKSTAFANTQTFAHRKKLQTQRPVPVSCKLSLLWVYTMHCNTIYLGTTLDRIRAFLLAISTWVPIHSL
jgi:hypothetical protein